MLLPGRRAAVILSLLLPAALSACSNDQSAAEPPPPPLTPVSRPVIEGNRDRDPYRALAALQRLGPCALLDPAKAKAPGVPATAQRKAISDTHCRIKVELNGRIDGRVHVMLDVDLDAKARWNLDRVSLSGATAYVHREVCSVMLPLSFTKVIHFSADGSVGRSVLCRRTEAFATAAVGVITKLRGTPILYRPDEPDYARPGGCADLIPPQEGCEPYQPVEAPTGTADVVRRVAADPYVNCAIAVDAVKARLGSEFTPVVIDNGSCRFVEPAHKLDLSVKVHNFSLGSFGNEVQIAGRAARHKVIDAGPGNRRGDMRFVHLDVAVDDYTTLRLELAEMRGRAATPGARIDTSREAALQPLAADIVTKYF